ncbi:MAG TPA: hypothetical protein VFO82_11900 [Steroidobacteraceae bacterium]|nr:hypothetical protein [Steroidobacteraceae bacterium]
MRNSIRILSTALAFSLFGAFLAGGLAQAEPRPYSKTLTFTLSTTNPAPPPAPRKFYAPANTKYSAVKLERTGTQVAVESLEIVHEGFRDTRPKPARPEGITLGVERLERVSK